MSLGRPVFRRFQSGPGGNSESQHGKKSTLGSGYQYLVARKIIDSIDSIDSIDDEHDDEKC